MPCLKAKENKEITKKILSAEEFLTQNIIGPKGTKLDITNVGKNAYRLNFWGKKVINKTQKESDAIVHSVYVILKRTLDGFEIKYKSDN